MRLKECSPEWITVLAAHGLDRLVPSALSQHLLDRKISATQLELLAKWLDTEREAPESYWYKRFSGMIVCGEGQLIQTFLLPGQAPNASMFREIP
jgi:hypothetical protein